MYVKLFEQIFDSSIAEDWQVRLVFEDMLILADKNGIVDITHEAIARRTNVPLDIIQRAIGKLEQPDLKSRRAENEGRRIVRIDQHRDWGWFITNYDHYRNLKTEFNKTEYMRNYMKNHRMLESVRQGSNNVRLPASASASASAFDIPSGLNTPEFIQAWESWMQHRKEIKKPLTDASVEMQMKRFVKWGVSEAIKAIEYTIEKGWQGIRQPDEGKTNKPTSQPRQLYINESLGLLKELREQAVSIKNKYGREENHRIVFDPKHHDDYNAVNKRIADIEKTIRGQT